MAEAKHSFVDDNPYLVYSPNAEAAPYKADTIDDYPEPFVIGG